MNIKRVIETLKSDEGCRLTPYLDTEQVWTVGHGHNMSFPISKEAAAMILRDDILLAIEGLNRHVPSWTIHDTDIQDMLVQLAYNLGIGGLLEFEKFLFALNRSDYRTAKRELLDSKWATQVKGRATRMANVFDRYLTA